MLTPQPSLLPESERVSELPVQADPTVQEPAQVEVLSTELSRLVQRSQKRMGRAIWSVPLTYMVMTAAVLLNVLMGDVEQRTVFTSVIEWSLGVFWIGLTAFMVASSANSRKAIRQLAQTLASLNDVRAAGSLIDTLKLEDEKTHWIALNALIGLLPRLQSSEADLLNAEQRAILCRTLIRPPSRAAKYTGSSSPGTHSRVVAYRLAILEAFGQIGDVSALPTVERLAHGKAETAVQKRIQEAAEACLPLLRLRAEQERSAQTLLRAAGVADAGAESLLRPTTGAPETPPNQLLRPGAPGS